MKTRTGFISNSSSSSFMIEESEFSTLYVMKTMLQLIQQEENTRLFAETDRDWLFNLSDTIERLTYLEQFYFDCNPGLRTTYSINEPTYVWRADKKILIQTCRNHKWENLNNVLHWKNNEEADWIDGEELQLFTYNVDEKHMFPPLEKYCQRYHVECKSSEDIRVLQLIELIQGNKKGETK